MFTRGAGTSWLSFADSRATRQALSFQDDVRALQGPIFSNSTDFLGSCQELFGVAFFQFSLFQALVWNTWGPIESGAQFAFDWDPATVAMFANWGTIMFLVSVLPLSKMIQVREGVKGGFLTFSSVIGQPETHCTLCVWSYGFGDSA